MACYAPCEYKREVSELRKKVELLESGLQTERLNKKLDLEKRSKLYALNERDGLKRKLEESQRIVEKLRDQIEGYKDQLVWLEEDRKKDKQDAAAKIRELKKQIGELEKSLSTATWRLEKQQRDLDKQREKELKEQREQYEKTLAELREQHRKEMEEKDGVIASLTQLLKDGVPKPKDIETKTPVVNKTRTTSRNSSTSPSQDPNHPVINNRTPSGLKPGAQKGHEAHLRKWFETPTNVVVLPVPQEVLDHPEDYYEIDSFKKQVVSLKLMVIVTQYEGKVYRHHDIRAIVKSPLPDDIGHLEVNYDSSVDAVTSYLHSVCNVPYNKVHELMFDATDGLLNISVGKLANLEKHFSELSEEERANIARSLFTGSVMNVDGTCMRVNGHQRQVLVMCNKTDVLYRYTGCKGDEAIKDTPVEHYQGTVVSDAEATFTKLGRQRQGCIIHESRYSHRAEQDTPELKSPTHMKELLQRIQHCRNVEMAQGKTCMAKEEREKIYKEYDEYVREGVQEYRQFCPELFEKHLILAESRLAPYSERYSLDLDSLSQHNRAGLKKDEDLCPGMPSESVSLLVKDINLLFRFITNKEDYLLFLQDYSIPPHNNDAEKCARTVKTHAKPNGGMRSEKYVGYYADTASVLETEQRQHRSRFKKLHEVFGRKAKKLRELLRNAGHGRKTCEA